MTAADIINSAITVNQTSMKGLSKTLPFLVRKAFELMMRADTGTLYIKAPSGQSYKFEGDKPGPTAIIDLKNWQLARKTLFEGTIGVGESYMNGDWDSPDVGAMLRYFLENRSMYQDVASRSKLVHIFENLRHWFNSNTRGGSKRNISAHYDLGNEFYSQWLDPSMTYSSAIFADGANSLERAQFDKYKSLADRLGIKKDSHVLEIGCGWGGFAEFAAKEIGAKVTGLTISREQLKFAQERIAKAGLQDRVELKFQDYRDEQGQYDHIVSIEMFEAVGEKYWPIYFTKLKHCLKPGGKAGLQIITISDEGFEHYRKRTDFIQKYIFPGGMLPSPSALAKVSNAHGLQLDSERVFPQDYARTLAEWRQRFWTKWDTIKKLGFDDRFKRMWEFYLFYCEAGFETESIDVRQLFYKHA